MEDNPCCQSMIQTFLIVFNFIAFFASGGVLGFSIYALVGEGFTRSLLPSSLPDNLADVLFDTDGKSFQLPLLLLAIVSSLVLLVSLLGCLGSCQQSRCLVALYFLCLLTFLLALMAGTAYCFMGDPQKPIAASMRLSMSRYKKDNLTRVLWDRLQSELKCCGTESIDDWGSRLGGNCSAPWSCMVGAGDRATAGADGGAGAGGAGGAGGGAGGADGASTDGGLPSQLPLVGGTAELPPSPAPSASTPPPTSNMTMKTTAGPQAKTTVGPQVCIQDLAVPHYNEGCLLKLQDALHNYITIIGAVMVAVWLILIINVLFSFALCIVLDYAEYTYK